MLCEVDEFRSVDFALISGRLIKINCDEFIAYFGSEFAIIHGAVSACSFKLFEFIQPLFQLLFIVILTVVFFALMLGSLLPSVLVQTVTEHEDKLYDLLVIRFTHHL